MQNLIRSAGVALVMVGMLAGTGARAVAAEDFKLAVVDMQKALQTVDAVKKAKAQLEKEFNSRKKDLQAEEATLKKMIEEFKKQKESEGYQIRKFKQPGTCYEIYGTDQSGKKVEVYFNPVDGSVVKSK
jgi:hypothetical protein